MSQQNITVPTDVQKQLQEMSEEYQKLQNNISEAVSTRQRLTAQQAENNSVAGVFKDLPASDEAATIYKLTGPVLLKQERGEAEQVVKGRLGYLGGEVERVEKQIKEWSERSESRKMEIYQIQSEAQEAAQASN